ncbi:N-acetylmuramoyl-L-alanine amidase [Gracilibacillus orientalis]|uniref:N-acetylmuramoyl-L-alanine amidase n=1 Tax=Gracilibacillus orientalis TaxID=334253 RepID=A0A1I4HAA2_9BACI|nr:N-acetylmuramoyl-L-alanine amidase [Gracilibacillus orientalis]SFL38603.1 N-acetylmuramoyl-L-alanine amidase [Gracilibacillus orientalis]
MVNIKKWIVPNGIANKVTYENNNGKKTVTIHQTGNTDKGANAVAHAKIQLNGNPREASWHYQADDTQVIQSFEDDAQCWHATDGRGPGNLDSIAIELCINSDGDYKKTLENGAELVKHLLDKHNLSINDVKQHHNWYPKNCPAQLRAGKGSISWNDFLSMVKGKAIEAPDSKVKSATTENKANLKVDGKWGNSTTRALQQYLDTVVDGIISDQVRNNVTNAFYGTTIDFGSGKKGSMAVKDLQSKIGAKVDGLLGPETIGLLQKYLGTTYDKKLSRPSIVVKELQRRLNEGTF